MGFDRARRPSFADGHLVVLLLAMAGGCGEDTVVSPPLDSVGSGGTAGAGGAGMGGGGAPPSGDPEALVTGRDNLQAIGVAGDRLVWTEFGTGSIAASDGGVMSCAVDGCSGGLMAIASSQPFPSSLALGPDTVYWADRAQGGVWSCPLDAECNAPAEIVPYGLPWDIAIDASFVYFTLGDDENGSVARCPLTGCDAGTEETLATAQNRPNRIVVHGGEVFWTSRGTPPDYLDGQLLSCPTAGCAGAPTIIATTTGPGDLAVDDERIYWSSLWLESISSCPRTGCDGAPTVVASELNAPGHIAIDSNRVYWSDLGSGPSYVDGSIFSCPLAGCGPAAPTIHATSQGLPRGIAVDDEAIYWVNGGDGRVMKASK